MANKVIILGATGGIGKIISEKLNSEKFGFKIFKVVRYKPKANNEIFWDYQSSLPKEFDTAFLVINCARSYDFVHNIKFNKILLKQLKKNTYLINFSSNCIYAKPDNFLSRTIFRGDAYIREKLAIEKLSQKRKSTFILRPTIVTGESSWKDFLVSCDKVNTIFTPNKNKTSIIKIISSDEVGEFVKDLILSNFNIEVPKEIYTNKIDTNDFIFNKNKASRNSNIFFDSNLKNIFTIILTSIFIPNWLAFRLQLFVMSRSKTSNYLDSEILKIEGMTRLYLFGGHTNHD